MNRRTFLKCSALSIGGVLFSKSLASVRKSELPNIVFILADDMGYGDVSSLNSKSKIQTPSIDRLVAEGVTFTDAHTNSGVCTPTRYGIITGRYCWRSRLKSKVLWNYAGCLIEKDRLTLPQMLKRSSYRTAMVGKWHLGIDWHLKDESKNELRRAARYDDYDNIDFESKVDYGINDYGFEYSFSIAGSANMTPFTFLENGKITSVPTLKTPEGWIGSSGHMAPGLKIENLLPTFTQKSCEFLESASKDKTPFFLYLALNSPHTPVCPNQEFIGKSGAGAYGDFVVETDYRIGQVMNKLRQLGIEDNTLVIFTSDNGPEIDRTREKKTKGDKSKHGHVSQSPYRGWKRMLYEGGHHVPFICRWPKTIDGGRKCKTTICVTDVMTTFAELTEQKLAHDDAPDSKSFLPAMLGVKMPESFHEAIVHHQASGEFALRKGDYKLIVRGPKTPKEFLGKIPEKYELYNLKNDIAEEHDICEVQPELIKEMYQILRKYISSDRSVFNKT